MELTKNKGITLIALVVTIIVLLILSGISIAMLTGDSGILSNSKLAKEHTQTGEINERVHLAYAAAFINEEGKVTKEGLLDELTNEFGDSKVSDDTVVVNPDGTCVVTIDETEVPISGKISDPSLISKLSEDEKTALQANGIAEITENSITNPNLKNNNRIKAVLTGEVPLTTEMTYITGTLNSGVVVSIDGSEFVWVPVPNVIWDGTTTITSNTYTPMAVLQENSTTDYRGVLYDFSSNTATYNSGYNLGTTSYREPDTLSYDASNSITESSLKDEYREVVTSVNKYKGFYVGRYELGLEGSLKTPVSKNASTNTGITTINSSSASGEYLKWYGVYNKLENMYNSASLNIKSTMLWGSQYDAMMNWMLRTGTNVSVQNLSITNRTQVTGSKTEDFINNIYDLYGCHGELTVETYGSNYRTYRGSCHDRGYDNVSSAPAARNTSTYANSGDDSEGGRCALYIK